MRNTDYTVCQNMKDHEARRVCNPYQISVDYRKHQKKKKKRRRKKEEEKKHALKISDSESSGVEFGHYGEKDCENNYCKFYLHITEVVIMYSV